MFKRLIALILSKYIGTGGQFLIKILCSKLLGITNYGVFVAALSTATCVSRFSAFGALVSLQKEAAESNKISLELVLLPALHASLSSAVLFFFLEQPILVFAPFILLFSCFSIYLLGREYMRAYFLFNNVPIFVLVLLLYLFEPPKGTLELFYLLILYCLPVFCFILLHFFLFSSFDLTAVRRFYKKNWEIFGATSLAFYNYRSILIFAPYTLSPQLISSLAIYHSFLELVVGSVGSFSSLLLNRLVTNRESHAQIGQQLFCVALFSIASSIAFWAYSKELIQFFFGVEYFREGLMNYYLVAGLFISINKVFEVRLISVSNYRALLVVRGGLAVMLTVSLLFFTSTFSSMFMCYAILYFISSLLLFYTAVLRETDCNYML